MLNFLIDANIPYADSAFSSLGSVSKYTERRPPEQALRKADVLLVRSITQVDQALLKDSRVQFIGTATIGVEHIDQDYLQAQGIGFSSSPGCNANAVSEYVLNNLLCLADSHDFQLTDKTVGIIGHGNVGRRVAQKLKTLGIPHVICDPPRALEDSSIDYVELDAVLAADIVTLHVPSVKDGPYPTVQLADRTFFERLSPEAIFINSSRGSVVDENALLDKLSVSPEFIAVLDVWQNEPRINPEVLRQVTIATPHIAGHSLEGKARGTEMLYQAVCKYFDCVPDWRLDDCLPLAGLKQLDFSGVASEDLMLRMAALNCYDPRRDNAMLRRMLAVEDTAPFFDGLRKNYAVRREFDSLQVNLPNGSNEFTHKLQQLGFNLVMR